MDRFPTIALILMLLVVFSLPASVSAATSPGVKPGSFFYFFDMTFEKIGLFFTFNPEKKARKALEYADERLAEIEAIAEEKDPGAIKAVITNYENNIALTTEKSKEVKDKGQAESLLASIKDNASKNQEVLSAILIRVPDEAKEAITQAIEASKKGQEEAVKQIAELRGDVEQLRKEVAKLKEVEKERQTTEVAKLKKELDELKKQKPIIVPMPAQTLPKQKEPIKETPAKETINTQTDTVTTTELNKETAIIIYKQNAEFFKRAIEETRKDYIPDIKNRRDKLTNRINLVRKTFITSGNLTKMNEIFDLFAQEHEREVKFIDEILAYIEQSLTSMSGYQAEYDRKTYLLLSDNKKVVTHQEIVSIMERNIDFIDTRYKGVENINQAMQNYYQSVSHKEDVYAEEYTLIGNALAQLGESIKISTPIYQPMPPIDFGLTARQELLLSPIRCTIGTIGGGGVELVVSCN